MKLKVVLVTSIGDTREKNLMITQRHEGEGGKCGGSGNGWIKGMMSFVLVQIYD